MTLDDIPILTSTYNFIEFVVQKEDKPQSKLPVEIQKKFDKWKREDFYDDSYKQMWDKNWITHDRK